MWPKNYPLQNIQLSKNRLPYCDADFSTSFPTAPEVLSRKLGGGEYRDRTGDLLVANQALSQLS
jgi:hypothetical protein